MGVSRVGIVLLLAGAVVGCDEEVSAGPFENIEGTYDLVAVNDSTVPVVVDTLTDQLYVAGTLDLYAEGLWIERIVRETETPAADSTITVTDTLRLSGAFTRAGSTLTLVDTAAALQIAAQLDGDEVAYERLGVELLFVD